VDEFFRRLKERKLVQWALAYAAGAFALLQALDIVGQQFGWPESVRRGITIALAVGFFIMLVIAWYHGEKGAQRVSGTELSILALLLAIGGAALWYLAPAGSGTATMMSAPLGPWSTAVLPFVNMSGDKGNEYFSDGMTETLLDRLAQVPQLKVAARTSSFSFKGTNTDVRKIGAALGVASLVEGSVQQAGDTLRITAQLVRAVDGSHLWSMHYDRKAADLFAIQDEIAGSVTTALVGELLPKTKEILAKGGTKDLAAYDAYTRGLQQIELNSFASYEEAVRLLQSALVRDPNYVDAMLALVHAWYSMAQTGEITPADYRERAEPMLGRVEAIAPDNGMLLAYRGEIAQERGEHTLAVQLGQRGVAAAPGDARTHHVLADIYTFQGDQSASLKEMDQVLTLNPLNDNVVRMRAFRLLALNRFDEAQTALLRALQLDPNNSSNYWMLGRIAYARGDLAQAATWELKQNPLDPADPEGPADLANILNELGETAAADAWLAESLRRKPGNLLAAGSDVALRYARGDKATAMEESIALIPRRGQEHNDYWRNAIIFGCLAADELGRTPQMRAALADAQILPRDLTPAGFKQWVGPAASPKVKLRELAAGRRCVFTRSDSDAVRREQLRAIFAQVEGAEWGSKDEWSGIAAELSNDPEAILAYYLPKDSPASKLPLREGSSRMLGIAEDPRVIKHFAEQREQIAQMRAALPSVLAKDGLSMLPQNSAMSGTTP
jgi:TolB-like protein/thioredoxin-like negative regulator of GroEL